MSAYSRIKFCNCSKNILFPLPIFKSTSLQSTILCLLQGGKNAFWIPWDLIGQPNCRLHSLWRLMISSPSQVFYLVFCWPSYSIFTAWQSLFEIFNMNLSLLEYCVQLVKISDMTKCEFKSFLQSKHQMIKLTNLLWDSFDHKNISWKTIISNIVTLDIIKAFDQRQVFLSVLLQILN